MTAHMFIIFIIVKSVFIGTVFIGAMYDPEGHAWRKITNDLPTFT